MEERDGSLGEGAWDNDAAAEWYATLFEETGLRDKVVAALDWEVLADDFFEVRAAAHVVVQLGRVYVWPIRSLQADLRLAIVKLEAVRNNLEREKEPYQAMIDGVDRDLVALRSRIND